MTTNNDNFEPFPRPITSNTGNQDYLHITSHIRDGLVYIMVKWVQGAHSRQLRRLILAEVTGRVFCPCR